MLPSLPKVGSAYLRLLIFLPAILIPACASPGPVFLMMYSAYQLNKQGDNIQPWHTPFPIWNQSTQGLQRIVLLCWQRGSCNKQQAFKSQLGFLACLVIESLEILVKKEIMVYVIFIGLHYSYTGCLLNQLMVSSNWDQKWVTCVQTRVSHYDNEIRE